MAAPEQLDRETLEDGLEWIRRSPREEGALEWIVRRPATNEREVLEKAELDVGQGLVGDNWAARGSNRTEDGSAHPEMQLNIMNARTAALVAQDKNRWALAGDQLYVDLDLSDENLPPGTQIRIGAALVEVTAIPHLGCKKFVERFGLDAMKFVNSKVGKSLNLRGINARVVEGGVIRVGDDVQRQ